MKTLFDTPPNTTNLILLDTETTGINDEDRVIQLGFMLLDENLNLLETHEELFSTSQDISFFAMETHNITPNMLLNRPKCIDSKTYKRLLELNQEESYIVIHNAPFDINMLKKEGFLPKAKIIDTLKVARHIYPDEESHRLQYLRYKFALYILEEIEAKKINITIKAHSAIGDVLILKLLLEKMITDLKDNALEKMLKLTNTPLFIKKLNFGKYKDRLLSEIATLDPSYLKWVLENIQDLQEDLKYSINLVLEQNSK